MSSFVRGACLPACFALIIGFSFRIFFAVSTPIGSESTPGELSSYNDEIAHANYTLYLLDKHTLPSQIEPIDEPGALERGSFENYQPPLYYIIHSVVASLFSDQTFESIVLSGRVLSIFFGVSLLLVFILVARVCQFTPIEIAAGLIFLSLSCVLIRFQAASTNDTLFWLLTGAVYWAVLKLERSELRIQDWLLFTLLASAALYTKLSALLLLPLPLLIIFQKRDFQKLLNWGYSVFLILILTIPIWIRNISEFGGILPLHAGFGRSEWRILAFESILFSYRSLIFPWTEFWQGIIGLMLISVPLIAVAVLFYRNKTEQSGRFNIFQFGFLITLVAFIWLNLQYDQAEFRYFFAAWPALAVLVSKSANSVSGLWFLNCAFLIPFLLFLT